jgi:hypothetical protein
LVVALGWCAHREGAAEACRLGRGACRDGGSSVLLARDQLQRQAGDRPAEIESGPLPGRSLQPGPRCRTIACTPRLSACLWPL